MIDPNLPDQEKIVQQSKIIDALVNRIERGDELQGSQFALFQSAITLQNEVHSKSKRLEEALSTLGSTVDELQTAYYNQEQVENNLSDALEALEEGFALFVSDRLVVSNEHFQKLLPDISDRIFTGLSIGDYIALAANSGYLLREDDHFKNWQMVGEKILQQPYYSVVAALTNKRWHQISFRRTSFGSIAVLQTDITATVYQNQLEKDRLIDQHARFLQGTFDHLVLGVASFSEDWQLQLHNKMFADLLFLPTSLQATETPVERIMRFLNERVLDENSSLNFDSETGAPPVPASGEAIQLVRRDGAILSANFLEHSEGGYIVNLRDITLQAKAEAALHRSNETLEQRVKARTRELHAANRQLQQQNRDLARTEEELRNAKELAEKANASKTRFLAAASHDLLQPVSAAKLYISMLSDGVGEENHNGYIERLDRAFQNVETLLHDLLDISHLESPSLRFNLATINMKEFIEGICIDLIGVARKKSINLKIRAHDCCIRSDEHYLGRILRNLIVNAIQYTNENGSILVGTRKRGDKIVIEVRDTGIGIDEDNLTSIFKEFTRLAPTDGNKTGVGLGLSIVDQACRHLGHPVTVHSKLGKGSLFRVEVPIAENQTKGKPVAIKSTDKGEESFSCLIFLIENDVDVLDATSHLLESWGASVIAVTSTEQAIEQYRELGEIPHLVIADYSLDGHDHGIRAINMLRQECGQSLPAIMVTANHSEALEQSGELLDFTVMKKPLNVQWLRKLIWKKARLESMENV